MPFYMSIEGVDGSGKATASKLIADRLSGMGWNVVSVSFPNYSASLSAKSIAHMLNGKFGDISAISIYFTASLYSLDRYETLSLNNIDIADADVVIFDRYTPSNIAYHCARVSKNQWPEVVKWIEDYEYVRLELPRVDLAVYLNIELSVSKSLVQKKMPRNYTKLDLDAFERDDKLLHGVISAYDYMVENSIAADEWLTVSVTNNSNLRPPASIADDVIKRVNDLL